MTYTGREPRPEKVAIVEEIRERLAEGQSALLVEMHGLTVAEATELRKQLREAGVFFKVYKNTLLHIATSDAGIEGLEPYLVGPTAIAVSPEDPGTAMRVLRDYIKEHEDLHVKVKGAVLGQQVLTAAEAETLADLPTYDQAIAMLAGALQGPMNIAGAVQAPLREFAGVLNAVLSGLGRVLHQVAEQREAA